jgi:hypothetical protein
MTHRNRHPEDAEAIWQFLSAQARSDTIEFVSDAYWSAKWYATIMAQIFNGAQPRELDQVLEMPGQIVINLETAGRGNCCRSSV